jgi:hypothetical protein
VSRLVSRRAVYLGKRDAAVSDKASRLSVHAPFRYVLCTDSCTRQSSGAVLQSVTARLGARWITCVNTAFWILGYTLVPRISHVRRLLLVIPCPSRGCHPSDRGCRVRAREATAERLGLDSADAVEILGSEEDECQPGRSLKIAGQPAHCQVTRLSRSPPHATGR